MSYKSKKETVRDAIGPRLSATAGVSQRLNIERAKALRVLRTETQGRKRMEQCEHKISNYNCCEHELRTNKQNDIERPLESNGPLQCVAKFTSSHSKLKDCIEAKEEQKIRMTPNDTTRMSVRAILAGSFTAKARGFVELLKSSNGDISYMNNSNRLSNRLSQMLDGMLCLEDKQMQSNGAINPTDEALAAADNAQYKKEGLTNQTFQIRSDDNRHSQISSLSSIQNKLQLELNSKFSSNNVGKSCATDSDQAAALAIADRGTYFNFNRSRSPSPIYVSSYTAPPLKNTRRLKGGKKHLNHNCYSKTNYSNSSPSNLANWKLPERKESNTLSSMQKPTGMPTEFDNSKVKFSSTELSWSSTRLHSKVYKVVRVTNSSQERLRLRVTAHGPGFALTSTNDNLLLLSAQECVEISIKFCPTVQGVAKGTLCVFLEEHVTNRSSSTPCYVMPLYAYGGHASFYVRGTHTCPIGTRFLDVGGDLHELKLPLQRLIVIKNKGPLPGFACVLPDALHKNVGYFDLRPDKTLLLPGSQVTVKIIYHPSKEYLGKISKQQHRIKVQKLTNMRVITGDEFNRQRIRRLFAKLTDEERYQQMSREMSLLCCEFPNEVTQVELQDFKESTAIINGLMSSLCTHNIAIVLSNNAADCTSDDSFSTINVADDTINFHTIYAATNMPTSQLALKVMQDHNSIIKSSADGYYWSVQPKKLVYRFGTHDNNKSVLFINNFEKLGQFYEIDCNFAGLFKFSPRQGYIESNGGLAIDVSSTCPKPPPGAGTDKQINILVRMENSDIEVQVECVYSVG